MKKRRSIFTFLLLSIFVITAISSIVISFNIINTGKEITNKLETSGVNVDVVNNPRVDIMVTQKDSNLDMSNFENDVKSKLQDYGIDTTNVNIQTVDRAMISTNASDSSTIFNEWGRIGVAGNWQLTTYNGTSVIWNKLNTNGATGFYSKENYNIKDATIDFDMRTTDSDDDYIGVFLRFNLTEDNANQANKKATSYLYIEQMNKVTDFKAPNGLYKMQNKVLIPTDSAGNSITTLYGNPVATSSTGWPKKNTWVHYKFVVEGNNIKAYRNGSLIINYTDTTSTQITKGSFGLVNWSQPAMFANFTVSYTVFKEFENVLREPSWRENAHHIVVNVDDLVDETLTGADTIGEILTRTLNDDIHFIQWGTNSNQSVTEDFIRKNDIKGIFVSNDDYLNCVEQTVIYIKNLIDQQNKEKYVIIGEDNDLSVDPTDLKNDAVSVDFPNGRWLVRHNYTYFANDLGQSTSAGVYTKDLTCKFDKPGEYKIYFDDNLVKTIYAHRRPVASFTLDINGNEIITESNSFDLDSEEDIGYGKGIASEKWYYKEVNEVDWTEGKITTFDNTKTYVIKLEVTDRQGETSYTTKYIGTGSPVATFNYNADTITKYQDLVINDTSYDPSGYEITNWTWVLKKDSVVVGTYNEKLPQILNFNTSELGVGSYSYSLVVTNSQGNKSEAYSKTFNVIEDTDSPEVLINPTYCEWKKSQEVSISFKDADSGFRNFRYSIDDVKETNENTVWKDYLTDSTYTLNITEEGQKYLHIEAYDNAGNLLERTVGLYKIDSTNPKVEYEVINPTESVRSAVIKFKGTDDVSGVEKIILPDGTQTSNQEIDYNVTKSGKYIFRVIDKAGNETVSEIDVTVPSEGVEVRYIDKITNENLADVINITGIAGDKYTTDVKQFDGYELVKVPDNANGMLEVDKIVVTYEYKKASILTIKYIDSATRQEILSKKEIIVREGEEYKTLPQGIEGYKVSNIPKNQNGIVGRENIEVVYEYKIITSGVIVSYVDEATNEILAESDIIEGKENDIYKTTAKKIDGYELVKVPANAEGKMSFGTTEVIYEYRKISNGVIVKYIDEITGLSIADNEEIYGLENDDYITTPKDIAGYKLVKIPQNATGKMDSNIIEVVYAYRKTPKLIIKYINEITKEEIIEKTELLVVEGEEYNTLPKNKDGYVLSVEPANKNGVVGKEDIEIIYEYRTVSAGLVVKYIDMLTDEIIEEKIYTGNEGEIIVLEDKNFDGYILFEAPENSQVTLTKDLQEVKYYYKKEIKLQVDYIDENTGEILYTEVKTGIEGENYTTEEKVFDGYELVKVSENKEGIYSRNNNKVVYSFKKKSVGVIVKYIDNETGKILEEKNIYGLENDIYSTEKLSFEKYKFVYSQGDTTGRMSEGITEVYYYYERKNCFVEVVYEDEDGNIVVTDAIRGKVDDKYNVEARMIEGYEIVEGPQNKEGIFSLDKITVKYIVRKIPYNLPDTSDLNVWLYIAMFVISAIALVFILITFKNKRKK